MRPYLGIAQFGRARGQGPRGRRFNSYYSDLSAIVNGSNSASKYTIDAPQGESVPIEWSADLLAIGVMVTSQTLTLLFKVRILDRLPGSREASLLVSRATITMK